MLGSASMSALTGTLEESVSLRRSGQLSRLRAAMLYCTVKSAARSVAASTRSLHQTGHAGKINLAGNNSPDTEARWTDNGKEGLIKERRKAGNVGKCRRAVNDGGNGVWLHNLSGRTARFNLLRFRLSWQEIF